MKVDFLKKTLLVFCCILTCSTCNLFAIEGDQQVFEAILEKVRISCQERMNRLDIPCHLSTYNELQDLEGSITHARSLYTQIRQFPAVLEVLKIFVAVLNKTASRKFIYKHRMRELRDAAEQFMLDASELAEGVDYYKIISLYGALRRIFLDENSTSYSNAQALIDNCLRRPSEWVAQNIHIIIPLTVCTGAVLYWLAQKNGLIESEPPKPIKESQWHQCTKKAVYVIDSGQNKIQLNVRLFEARRLPNGLRQGWNTECPWYGAYHGYCLAMNKTPCREEFERLLRENIKTNRGRSQSGEFLLRLLTLEIPEFYKNLSQHGQSELPKSVVTALGYEFENLKSNLLLVEDWQRDLGALMGPETVIVRGPNVKKRADGTMPTEKPRERILGYLDKTLSDNVQRFRKNGVPQIVFVRTGKSPTVDSKTELKKAMGSGEGPISHWIAVRIAGSAKKPVIEYYDSLGGSPEHHADVFRGLVGLFTEIPIKNMSPSVPTSVGTLPNKPDTR